MVTLTSAHHDYPHFTVDRLRHRKLSHLPTSAGGGGIQTLKCGDAAVHGHWALSSCFLCVLDGPSYPFLPVAWNQSSGAFMQMPV